MNEGATKSKARAPYVPAIASPRVAGEVISAIAHGRSGPVEAAWVRDLIERADRRGARNVAIRAAAALMPPSSISVTAKALESALRNYLRTTWLNGDRDLAGRGLPAPDEWSALRRELYRIAKLTDGEGRGWRQILRVIEAR